MRAETIAEGGGRFARPEAGEDGAMRISGYASLFGVVDLSRDMVERGAFAKSLRDKGSGGIRMLFQHDPAQPVGRWTAIREDERGLFVEGRLAAGARKALDLARLIRAGALDGLSIGFKTVRAANDPRGRVRRVLEADLWEISIVTFPMLPGARIAELKRASDGDAHQLARRIRAATTLIQGKDGHA